MFVCIYVIMLVFILYNDIVCGKSSDSKESFVFANREIALQNINVYGFDYDYTLISYKSNLTKWIYDQARRILIDSFMVCTPILLIPI